MPKRPNLLLITTDQQRFDTIAAAGYPHMRTPHLDWLLESGVHFKRAYTDSPVCVPARATMLTGKHFINLYPDQGNWNQPTTLDPDSTLPSTLARAGYQTKSVGKLHYHPARANYGWQDAEILEDYYTMMRQHPEKGAPMDHGLGQNEMHPGIATVSESNSLTHWIVDRSIDFLETRDPTRPFLLNIGFSKPHPPFDPCLPYWLMYQNTTVPDPVYGDWSASPDDVPAGFMGPTWNLNGIDRFSPELVRDARRAYYALISQIDYNLGLLFSRLRELGELENTLILFTSDHGEMLGDHHMGAKVTFFEPSAHVPMILRPPAGEGFERYDGLRGKSSDELVCLADIMATFLAAADEPAPAGGQLDGLDLVEVARGKARREAIVGLCGNFSAVIESRYAYHFTEAGGSELLFDLQEDPQERRNLATNPECSDTLERLRKQLADTLSSRGHPAAKDGALQSTKTPLSRREARIDTWPGFHHPWHTAHDVLH